MGEYYNWVNIDKKEYLCPSLFHYGSKQWESLTKWNDVLRAVYELLASDWKGDHIIWFGDEKALPENSDNQILNLFYTQTIEYGEPGDGFDMMCETYRNLSGLYKAAEEKVREEIEIHLYERMHPTPFDYVNEYQIDPANPYQGLFQRDGKRFKFIINETKKVYYSPDNTFIYGNDGVEREYADPFPLLMRYGRVNNPGLWLGDIISVADEIDETKYTYLDRIYLDW